MTTLLQLKKPDKLLETLKIELTEDQRVYLKQNKRDLRTLLLKKFNLHFGTKYTKLQLTQAIAVMREPRFKPTGKKKVIVRHHPNCYWVEKRQRWVVQFRQNGKSKTLGYFKDFEDAKAFSDKYRKNSA